MNNNLANTEVPKPDKTADALFRKSSQFLMPARLSEPFAIKGEYNIYPFSSLGDNKIFNGYYSLAQFIIQQKTVVIDGYAGVFWDKILLTLHQYFEEAGLKVNWVKTQDFFKSKAVIEELVQPFLGAVDSVWGTKCSLTLRDLYEIEKLTQQSPDKGYDINIVIGTAAVLFNWNVPVIYIDLPKNELQLSRIVSSSIFTFNLFISRLKAFRGLIPINQSVRILISLLFSA